MATLPSHEAMTAHIVDAYRDASPAQLRTGHEWYPSARVVVDTIAGIAGMDVARVTHALAALSPRNPWMWNVADCYAFTMAASSGDPMPSTATTFGRNAVTAWDALTSSDARGHAPWTSAAPKVRAFVRAILGDPDAVVVDVWAMRVATNGEMDAVRPNDYWAVRMAYVAASLILFVAPRDVQAVTWLVAQSKRRDVRHNRTLKRGTPSVIVTLLTGQLGLPL